MKDWDAETTEGEVVEVAKAGLCGMIEAIKEKGEDFSSDLTINAAIHILSPGLRRVRRRLHRLSGKLT